MAVEFRANGVPHKLEWIRLTISRKCNQLRQCRHCSQDIAPNGPRMAEKDLAVFAKSAIPVGIDEVYVSGGEVFTDVKHLVSAMDRLEGARQQMQRAHGVGFRLVIETNGFWLLKPGWQRLVDSLQASGFGQGDRIDIASQTPMHAEAGLDIGRVKNQLTALDKASTFSVAVWETTSLSPGGQTIKSYPLFQSPGSHYPPIRKECFGIHGNKKIGQVVVDFNGRFNFCNEEVLPPFGDMSLGDTMGQIERALAQEPFLTILSGDIDRLADLTIDKSLSFNRKIAKDLLEQGRYCEYCAHVFRGLPADLIKL